LGVILKNGLITGCRRKSQTTKEEDGNNGLKQDKPIVGWGHDKGHFFPIPFWLSLSYTFRKVVNMGVLTRAFRNVSRRKIRVLLVVIALGFSMAIMISIPAGIMANQKATEQLSANYNAYIGDMEEEINKTLTLIECSLSSGFSQNGPGFMTRNESFLNETAVFDISVIDGVKDVLPFIEKTEGTVQTRQTPRGTFEMLVPEYTIVGVPLNDTHIDNYVVLPKGVTEGRNLEEGDSGVVLLSKNNTEYFGVGVGDKVNILGSYFTVIGVYETSDRLGLGKLYMNISDAQAITNLEGQISRIDVYAEDQSYVDEIVSNITSLYPEFRITTYEERLSQIERMQGMYQSTLENAEATLGQTQAVAFQEVGVAVVATSLIVLFTMLYTVRERTQEIGVLKAIGFSNWSVMSQFVLEGVFISLIAAVVGITIATMGAPILSSLLLPSTNPSTPSGMTGRQTFIPGLSLRTAAAAPDLQLMLLTLGAAVLLGALGALYPAWRASKTSPMEALRHE
jgi:putative ABC transport system permease protein